MPGKRKSEARRWFQQAVYDLEAARWNIQGGFFDTACFLSQQAAEKGVKSLLHYLSERRTALMTHSLVEMIQQVQKQIETMSPLLPEARALGLHYIPSRHPNGLPAGFPHQFYTKPIAEEAANAANKILEAVKEIYRARGEEELLSKEV